MKTLKWLGLLTANSAIASASPFAGTWILQPELTQLSGLPPTFSVDNGKFQRSNCLPPLEVNADGADHPISGGTYFDTLAAQTPDHTHVDVTQKLNGLVTWHGHYTVSADGASLTLDFTDSRARQPVTGQVTYSRVGTAAPGQHPLSGVWQPNKLAGLSSDTLNVSFKDSAEGLAMQAGTGRSFEAKNLYTEVPVTGDAGADTVLLAQLGPQAIQMNYKRNGRLTEVSRNSISPDGRTMTTIDAEYTCQTVTRLTYRRQQ